MAGVKINVETRSENTQAQLRQINKHLADIVRNSNLSSKALGGLTNKNIISTSNSLKKLEKNPFNKITQDVKKTNSSVFSLKNLLVATFATFTAYKGVSGFNQMADDLTRVNNRLKLVTNSINEMYIAQGRLFRISQTTFSELGSNADLYVDFSKALEKSRRGSSNVFQIVEQYNKMGALSGSSRESLRAATIQFTQGLASGTLRGEELNSVMEQMKYLSFGLQKYLNMNAGALRKFAEEGRLTVDVLLDVFDKMADQTEKDFAKISLTAEMAMTRLKNSLRYAIGEVNLYLGFSEGFARRINSLATSIDEVGNSMISSFFTLERGITNYIRQFTIFDALELTAKALIRLEVSPLDIISTYNRYKATDRVIDNIVDMIDERRVQAELKKKAEELSGFKLALPVFGEIDLGFGSVKRTNFGVEVLKDIISLASIGKSSFDLLLISAKNFINLFTVVIGPTFKLVASTIADALILAAKGYTRAYDKFYSINALLRDINENLNLFVLGTNIERAWARLFRSDSIQDFAANFKKLNQEIKTGRVNDWRIIFGDFRASIFEATAPVQRFLISVGLMEQRLIRLQAFRLDRVIAGFEILANTINEVTKAVIIPKFLPIFLQAYFTIQLAATATFDAIANTFNQDVGENIGRSLVRSIVSAFKYIGSIFKDNAVKYSDLIQDDPELRSQLSREFIRAFKNVGLFIYGFIKGVFSEIFITIIPLFTAAINVIVKSIEDLYNKIKTRALSFVFNIDFSGLSVAFGYLKETLAGLYRVAKNALSDVIDLVRAFATSIIDFFKEIYIKVVGNSYWPDTLEGLEDGLTVLEEIERKFYAFKENIISYFKELQSNAKLKIENFEFKPEKIKENAIAVKNKVVPEEVKMPKIDLAEKIYEVKVYFKSNFPEWLDQIQKEIIEFSKVVSSGLLAAIMAAFFFFIGGMHTKLLIIGHLISKIPIDLSEQIQAAVDNLMVAFAGAVKILSAEVGNMVADVVKEFIIYAPKIVSGLIKGIGEGLAESGLGGLFRPVFGFVSFLLEKLPMVSALLAAISLYIWKVPEGAANVKSFFETLLAPISKDKALFPLFNSKMLAVGAAAAIVAGMTEAFDIVSSTGLGLGLLALSILGSDGGARFIADIVKSLATQIMKLPGALTASMAVALTAIFTDALSIAWGSAIIAGIFASKFLGLTDIAVNIGKTFWSRFAAGFTSGNTGIILPFLKSVIGSIKYNKMAYAEGKASLAQLFLRGPSALQIAEVAGTTVDKKDKDRLKRTYTNRVNTAPLLAELARYQQIVQQNFSTVTSTIVAWTTQAFTALRAQIVGWAIYMGSLLTSLFKALTLKHALIVAGIAGLFASFSSEAAVSADIFADTAKQAGLLAVNLVAAGIALTTIGAMIKTIQAYRKGKKDFITSVISSPEASEVRYKQYLDMLRNESAYLVASKRLTVADANYLKTGTDFRSKNATKILTKDQLTERLVKGNSLFPPTIPFAGSFTHPFARENVKTKERQFKEAFKTSQTAIPKEAIRSAGFKAMNEEMKKMPSLLSSLMLSLSNLKAYLAANFSVSIAHGLITPFVDIFEKFLVDLPRKTGSALKKVGGPFKPFGRMLILQSKAVATLGGAFVALYGAIAGLSWKNLGLSFRLLGRSVRYLLLSFAAFGPILKFVAILTSIAATGSLLAILMGNSNELFDKLNWVFDKIKAIFGLRPTSAQGRFEDALKGLANLEFKEKTLDFTMVLSRVDFSKMSKIQELAFNEAMKEAATSLKDLQKLEVTQGGLTERQKEERNRVERDVIRIASKQPQRELPPVDKALENIYNNIRYVDNSLWNRFKRALGWKPILDEGSKNLASSARGIGIIVKDEIGSYFKAFGGALVDLTKWIYGIIKTPFQAIGEAVQDAIDALMPEQRVSYFQDFLAKSLITYSKDYVRFQEFARKEDKERIDKSRERLEVLSGRLFKLREQGAPTGNKEQAKAWTKGYNAVLTQFNEEFRIFVSAAIVGGVFARLNSEVEKARAPMKSLGKFLSESLDVNLGESFEKATFGRETFKRLVGIRQQYRNISSEEALLSLTTKERVLAYNRMVESLKRQAKALSEIGDKFAFVGSIVDQLKDKIETITTSFVLQSVQQSPITFKETLVEATRLEERLAQINALPFDAPAEIRDRLIAQAQDAAEDFAEQAKKLSNTFVEGLNEGISGLDANLPVEVLPYLSEGSLASLSAALNEVSSSKILLEGARLKGPEAERAALLDIEKKKAIAVRDVYSSIFQGGLGKNLSLFGKDIPDEIKISAEKTAKWLELNNAKFGFQALLKQANIDNDMKGFAEYNKAISQLDKQMANLSNTAGDLDSLLSAAGGLGLSLDSFQVAGNYDNIKELLKNVEGFDKSTIDSSNIDEYNRRKTGSMLALINLVSDTYSRSIEGIQDSFATVGVTVDNYANVSNQQLESVYKNAIDIKKLQALRTYYISQGKSFTEVEKRINDIQKSSERLFETWRDKKDLVNEIFETELSDKLFAATPLQDTLVNAARYYAAELENVYRTGKTRAGEVAESFFDDYSLYKAKTRVIGFIDSVKDKIKNLTIEDRLESAQDRFQGISDIELLRAPINFKENFASDQLRDLVRTENLDKSVIDQINEGLILNLPTTEILERIKIDLPKTPIEQLSTGLGSLEIEVAKLNETLRAININTPTPTAIALTTGVVNPEEKLPKKEPIEVNLPENFVYAEDVSKVIFSMKQLIANWPRKLELSDTFKTQMRENITELQVILARTNQPFPAELAELSRLVDNSKYMRYQEKLGFSREAINEINLGKMDNSVNTIADGVLQLGGLLNDFKEQDQQIIKDLENQLDSSIKVNQEQMKINIDNQTKLDNSVTNLNESATKINTTLDRQLTAFNSSIDKLTNAIERMTAPAVGQMMNTSFNLPNGITLEDISKAVKLDLEGMSIVIEESMKRGIDPWLALSIWKQESGGSLEGKPGSMTKHGRAQGRWQIMPFHGDMSGKSFKEETQFALDLMLKKLEQGPAKHLTTGKVYTEPNEIIAARYYGLGNAGKDDKGRPLPTTQQYVETVLRRIEDMQRRIIDYMNSKALVKAATGGYIRGPGTPTSDSIPAMLSNGEYVINAASTRKHYGLIDAINKDSVSKFSLGGYTGVGKSNMNEESLDYGLVDPLTDDLKRIYSLFVAAKEKYPTVELLSNFIPQLRIPNMLSGLESIARHTKDEDYGELPADVLGMLINLKNFKSYLKLWSKFSYNNLFATTFPSSKYGLRGSAMLGLLSISGTALGTLIGTLIAYNDEMSAKQHKGKSVKDVAKNLFPEYWEGYAAGGYINGPGGPKEDKIPAMLSNGEYVINAAATRKHYSLIDAINRDSLPGFSTGGLAGSTRSPGIFDDRTVRNIEENTRITAELLKRQLAKDPQPVIAPDGQQEAALLLEIKALKDALVEGTKIALKNPTVGLSRKVTGAGISMDESVLRRADRGQIRQLSTIVDEILKIQIALTNADLTFEGKIDLERQLYNLGETFRDVEDGIRERLDHLNSSLNGMVDSLHTSIMQSIRGQMEEGRDFMDILLDRWTEQILNDFLSGLLKGFKDSKMMANFLDFETLGADLFNSIFKAIKPDKIFDGVAALAVSGSALLGAAGGGYIRGPGGPTSDSIPAMLSNGEYVINAASTKRFAPVLAAINANKIPKFALGGPVASDFMRTPTLSNVDNDLSNVNQKQQQVFNINVTGDISRQTKAEIYRMIPQIAGGVNSYHREKGIR